MRALAGHGQVDPAAVGRGLHEVVDFHSQFVLGRFAALGLPPVHPPEHDGPPEALTPEQKSDLIAFLHRL